VNEFCVIAAVGRSSLHREWIYNDPAFDLHLIVYDDSYERFKMDTPFITKSKGHKFSLMDNYLAKNGLLERYKYFYMPDDDILINGGNIEKLFWYMEEYKFDLAQPAISKYYVSFAHTLRRKGSTHRSTNFVEIMQPCFSRSALKKVKFTFSTSVSGWGIDMYWAKLLKCPNGKMAIIDDVISVHTRPVRSDYSEEFNAYMEKYNLSFPQMR
jgi:hypothetical protein